MDGAFHVKHSSASVRRIDGIMSAVHHHRLGVYRREGDRYLIEIKLRDTQQLFNTLDPSPFHEKDLDAAAEEYLVSAAREIGAHPGKLVLHLPADSPAQEDATVGRAIRHYFNYRARQTHEQLRLLLGRGAMSFAIGLAFLIACLMLRQLLGASNDSAAAEVGSEGLLILGWVAMWRPVEIFLYDWWPEFGKRRLFERIAAMNIEVRRSRRRLQPAQDQFLISGMSSP